MSRFVFNQHYYLFRGQLDPLANDIARIDVSIYNITYTNCPTVKSAGTKYFFLSISLMSERPSRSQITGILSGYFVGFGQPRSCAFLRRVVLG